MVHLARTLTAFSVPVVPRATAEGAGDVDARGTGVGRVNDLGPERERLPTKHHKGLAGDGRRDCVSRRTARTTTKGSSEEHNVARGLLSSARAVLREFGPGSDVVRQVLGYLYEADCAVAGPIGPCGQRLAKSSKLVPVSLSISKGGQLTWGAWGGLISRTKRLKSSLG